MAFMSLPDEWNDWQIIEQIGSGSFGTVFKAVNQNTGDLCALKHVRIPSDDQEMTGLIHELGTEMSVKTYLRDLIQAYLNEIQAMDALKHSSHVVQIQDSLIKEDPERISWDIYIRMELLKSFREFSMEQEITEEEVVKLGVDICKALEECEKHGIIHRDIKPDNIFVDNSGHYKLGDFGVARRLDRTYGSFSAKGTYNYMAPEVYHGERYDHTVDLYSLGLVMYRLMNKNRAPFVSIEKQVVYYKDREAALQRRMDGEPLPRPVEASEAFSMVILTASAYLPKNRYQSALELSLDLKAVLTGNPKTGIRPYNKKRFCAVLVLTCILSVLAVGYVLLHRKTSPVPDGRTVLTSLDEDSVLDFFFDAAALTKDNYKEFSELFVNTEDELIQKCFSFWSGSDLFENYSTVKVGETEDMILYSVTGYNTSNAENMDTIDSGSWNLFMKKTEDGYKFDFSDEDTGRLVEWMKDNGVFPSGYLSAAEYGRNNIQFDRYNYMYVEEDAVYNDLLTLEVKYLWQEENGDLRVDVFITNGLDQDALLSDIHISLVDAKLAMIVKDISIPDQFVKAGRNLIYEGRINADLVITGNKDWTDVTANKVFAATFL